MKLVKTPDQSFARPSTLIWRVWRELVGGWLIAWIDRGSLVAEDLRLGLWGLGEA